METPIWIHGRVPNGYWSSRPNRLRYMNWLGRRLRFKRPADWYRLTRQDFLDHSGAGLLATTYEHSPLVALRDYAPRIDWKPWLMGKTPQRYWKNPAHRHDYMTWLGKKMRFKTDEDWYALSKHHFIEHGGQGLLANYYRNSPIDALREHKPQLLLDEWCFAEAPQRFWHCAANRTRYVKWLGGQLGYTRIGDWYWVKRSDFIAHQGSALLQSGYSPLELLREAYPHIIWLEWHFWRVPNGFWKKRDNRVRYLAWLADEHGLRTLEDWMRLDRQVVRDNGGGALLVGHYNNSMRKLRGEASRWIVTRGVKFAA